MDKMNNNTLRITTGAMILAIFAMLLLLNRQTGGVFEGFFIRDLRHASPSEPPDRRCVRGLFYLHTPCSYGRLLGQIRLEERAYGICRHVRVLALFRNTDVHFLRGVICPPRSDFRCVSLQKGRYDDHHVHRHGYSGSAQRNQQRRAGFSWPRI